MEIIVWLYLVARPQPSMSRQAKMTFKTRQYISSKKKRKKKNSIRTATRLVTVRCSKEQNGFRLQKVLLQMDIVLYVWLGKKKQRNTKS